MCYQEICTENAGPEVIHKSLNVREVDITDWKSGPQTVFDGVWKSEIRSLPRVSIVRDA